jgi:hypothetical protein
MNLKRMTAAAVVATLMVGFLPATAWAAESDKKNDKVDLRGATAKVLASTNSVGQVTTPAPAPGKPQKSNRRNSSNGGGGGTTGTVMMIVGIAASLGATYFVIKEMNKTTEQLTATPHAVR